MKNILSRFPNIELSYEIIAHKKVSNIKQYNTCLAIPNAKKYIAWFTFYEDKNVCILKEVNRNKSISNNIQFANTFFNTSLSIGTILYGSLIQHDESKHFFVIEDILLYKGIHIHNLTFGQKLNFINDFMNNITQKFPITKIQGCKYDIVFSLPIMWNSNEEMPTFSSYQLHHCQYRSLNEIVPYINLIIKRTYVDSVNNNYNSTINTSIKVPQVSTISSSSIPIPPSQSLTINNKKSYNLSKLQYNYKTTFKVMADIQNDIYHLFAYGNNGAFVYYDIAYIPNYKTSIFMNNLFRNIKENKNIDYIEESDDDEDFQNTNYDKYVNLTKYLHIDFLFHPKFKKWYPIGINNDKYPRIIHINKLV